jgi:clan AA aspartic protease (TIGR02281 family)
MGTVKRAAWLCVPISGLAVVSAAFADCRLLQVAELKVSVAHNRPVMDGQINDQPVKILVDTGSSFSFLWQDEAKRLGLPIESVSGMHMYGVGGEARVLATQVKRLQIGGFSFKDMNLMVIGADGGSRDTWNATLVLGEDFFSKFATEFDLANGVIRLLRPEDCKPEQLAYWGKSYSMAEIDRTNEGAPSIEANVLVNGRQVHAVLDTGAPTTQISRSSAERAGVAPGLKGVAVAGAAAGIAGKKIEAWEGTFSTFALGDEVVRNVKFGISDLFGGDTVQDTGSNLARPVNDLPSMLIGCDFFLSHHIMVLFKEHKLLFTYNGGPIFQTVAHDPPVPGSSPSADNQ